MEDKIRGNSKFGVNGLGPPIETAAEFPIENQDAVIWRLKRDLEICMGKIKGYETLGHMLHESKLECARYKQVNEDLAKKLDNLSQCLPALGTGSEKPAAAVGVIAVPSEPHKVQGWLVFDGKERLKRSETDIIEIKKLTDIKKPRTSTAAPQESVKEADTRMLSDAVVCSESVTFKDNKGHQSYETEQAAEPTEKVAVNLDELGAKTPPGMSPPRRSSNPSNFSSASFVRISNSPSSEDSSRRSSGADQIEQGVIAGNDELSAKISHLAKQLEGISNSASVEDLAADLMQASVLVTKLQKEAKIQQVLITEMTKQISELKADLFAKHQTIQILQKESDSLRNTLKRMVAAREQAIQEARNENFREGDFGSVEWVELEDQQAAGKASGADIRQPVVNSVPITEIELRNRIEKLNTTVTELVSVNHGWDNHCRQLTAAHEQQIVALQSVLNEAQLRCDEYERAAKSRQHQLDDMILGVKKQREADEIAKQETQSEFNVEKSRRVTTELKCMELSQKVAELEQRLQYTREVEFTPQNVQAVRLRMSPSSSREEELATQLFIVQEQVNIFKEDFDKERRDRESAIAEVESLRKIQKSMTEQLYTSVNQLARTQSELEAARKEADTWRQRFMKLSDEVQALQRTARPQEARQSTGSAVVSSAQTPIGQAVNRRSPVASNLVEFPSWNCLMCTFNNAGHTSRCEMCGKRKPGELQQSSSFSIAGGHSVVGLQPWNPEVSGPWLIPRGFGGDVPDESQ